MASYDLHEKAAAMVRDAGGKIVGRTRLQKVTYLSQLAGFFNDFSFEYRHYGPFSEDLSEAMKIASGLQLVVEEEKKTDWNAWYSIYQLKEADLESVSADSRRTNFVAAAASVSAIELELAATAAYLFAEEGIGNGNDGDPWEETRQRKPEKSENGRLEKAKASYLRLKELETPVPLPSIV